MNKLAVRQSQELIAKNRAKSLEQVLIQGDLSSLSEHQRLDYVQKICKFTGVSILMRPFDYIVLNNKLVLYANRSCTDQLRRINKISIKIVSREKVDGLYVVTADASGPKGKTDSAIGAVNIQGLRGVELANALMKAETKAKRRVTLSICGLGILDEIEAREILEREAKVEAREAVEAVEEKVEESKDRPEFESVQTQAVPEAITPQVPTSGDYILLAGKIKGKRLREIPLKKLADWLVWYEGWKQKGNQQDDVDQDAVHISRFLTEVQTTRIET